MTSPPPTLSDLRREIDSIDESLHDLLMRRAEIVDGVRQAKQVAGGSAFRPAREAQVLRHLVGRHRGSLPRGLIVRLWRELMSASAALQAPFAIAVCDAGPRGAGYWDLARDHFGGLVPMRRHASVRGVVHAIAEGDAALGVLPLPEDGEGDPWWPALGGGPDVAALRICARLPFAPGGNGQGAEQGALVVGDVPFDRSGDDRSYLLIESPAGMSRTSLVASLTRSELRPIFVTAWQDGGAGATALNLVEVDDYVGGDDPRLGKLADAERTLQVRRAIGGYATPLDESNLGLAARRPGAGAAR